MFDSLPVTVDAFADGMKRAVGCTYAFDKVHKGVEVGVILW